MKEFWKSVHICPRSEETSCYFS